MQTPSFSPRPAEGLKYPNVMAMFAARAAKSARLPALRYRRDGAWRSLSWSEWKAASLELAAGLAAQGIGRGDRVAIWSPTRLEWALCDLAIAMAGAVSVPIYPSLVPDDIAFIVADSGCKAAFIEHPGRAAVLAQSQAAPRIICFDRSGPGPDGRVSLADLRCSDGEAALSIDDVRALGARQGSAGRKALETIAAEVGLDDELTYVYTSGTTGRPKGVVLTHKNLVYEAWAIKNVVPVDETDQQLLALPLAHIFARHLLWAAVEQGAVTAFGESPQRLVDDLQEVAPTFFGGVPRLYEQIHQRIWSAVSAGPVRKAALRLAMDVGGRLSRSKQRGKSPPVSLLLQGAVADRLVLGRIQALFGGRLRFAVSGGAALSVELAEFFHSAGILVLEGYGLSETTGATNVNRPDRYRFGTVGPAMPGCEIRIAPDGEVLVRGHNVMARYHNLPEETAAVIDEQGWFHTGDIGELEDGFLRITDRKKDLFKTASGKYVAPRPIEKKLELRSGVSKAVVVGDAQPYPVALLTVDEAVMMRVSDAEGLGCRTYADLVAHPRVRQLLQAHVDDVNATLAPFETIRRFAIVPVDFTEARGELTPTLKVRRKVVLQRYAGLVEQLYPRGIDEDPDSADAAEPLT